MCNRVPKADIVFFCLTIFSFKQLFDPKEKLLINWSKIMINMLLENRLSKSKSYNLIEIADIVKMNIEKVKKFFDHLVAVLYLYLSISVIDALRNIEIVT